MFILLTYSNQKIENNISLTFSKYSLHRHKKANTINMVNLLPVLLHQNHCRGQFNFHQLRDQFFFHFLTMSDV